MKLIPCEVKEYAVEKNIKVYQPEKLRENKEIVNILKDINPNVICVVAYGKIIPKEILEIPKYGCVNVHPSLLPQYRGSAPIQWAILNGDKETGVTTMYLDEGMDSGDIILQTKTPIDKDETSGELWDRLSKIGAELLVETLEKIENKTAPRIKQPKEFTLAPMLEKSQAKIDWESKTAEEIDPGTVLYIDKKEAIYIMAKEGILKVLEIQGENAKRMPTPEFLRGNRIEVVDKFE